MDRIHVESGDGLHQSLARGVGTAMPSAWRVGLKAMGQPNYANGFNVATHEDALFCRFDGRSPR